MSEEEEDLKMFKLSFMKLEVADGAATTAAVVVVSVGLTVVPAGSAPPPPVTTVLSMGLSK